MEGVGKVQRGRITVAECVWLLETLVDITLNSLFGGPRAEWREEDVVFNHTNAIGENPNAVLDEIVPDYYNRLIADGNQLSGSCCPDTAAEHKMMGKRSLTLWC